MTSKSKKTKTQPILPLVNATDKAAFFPNWVTDQVKAGDVNPVMTAYTVLPVHRRNNVKRKWETAMHEEELDLKDDEREKWLNDAKEVNKSHGGVTIKITCYRDRGQNDETKGRFENSEVAAKALSEWLTKHTHGHAELHCDEFPTRKYDFEVCFQLVSKDSDIKFWAIGKKDWNIRTQTLAMAIHIKHDEPTEATIQDCKCWYCSNYKNSKKTHDKRPKVEEEYVPDNNGYVSDGYRSW